MQKHKLNCWVRSYRNLKALVTFVMLIISFIMITSINTNYAVTITASSTTANKYIAVRNTTSTALSVALEVIGVSTSDSGTPRKLSFTDSIHSGVTRTDIHHLGYTSKGYVTYCSYYDLAGSTQGQSGTLAIIGSWKSSPGSEDWVTLSKSDFTLAIPDTPASYDSWNALGGTNRTISRSMTESVSLGNALRSNKCDYVYKGERASSTPTASSVTGNYSQGKITISYTKTDANYQIGSSYYSTLAEAVSACSSGGTITVYSTGFTDSSSGTISKNLTLNTNGKTVTRTAAITISSGYTVNITGSGTLTTATSMNFITNNGTLNLTSANIKNTLASSAGNTVVNNGTMTINSGTISTTTTTANIYALMNNKTLTIKGGTISSAYRALGNTSTVSMSGGTVKTTGEYALVNGSAATATVTGGTITSPYTTINNSGTLTVSNATITSTDTTNNRYAINGIGKCTINSGTITSAYGGIYNAGTETLEIKGGKITANGNGGAWSSAVRGVCGAAGSTIKISGGEITATNTSTAYGSIGITSTGTVIISGGTITANSYYAAYAVEAASSTAVTGSISISGSPSLKATATVTDGVTVYARGVSVQGYSDVIVTFPVTISGGTITATGGSYADGIRSQNNSGAVTITGGTVKGDRYGIFNVSGGGSVTLGNASATLSTTAPSVSGGSYGIYAAAGFTFSNGVIKGTNKTPYYGTAAMGRGNDYVVKITGPSSSLYSAYLQYDSTDPTISSFSLSATTTNQATFTATANVTDAASGVASVTFIAYTGATTLGTYSTKITGSASGSTYTATITFANILNTSTGANAAGVNGTYMVLVRAVDEAGNSVDSSAQTIIYDTFAPTNGRVSINNNAEFTNSRNVTLSLYAEDATSGMKSMAISNAAGGTVTYENYATTKSWTLSNGDGLKTVYVVYKDAAGNTTVVF